MTIEDIKRKNLILIKYLNTLNDIGDFKFKAEFSTNDNDTKVVVVQEQTGTKIVFYGNCPPLFNYYSIEIFGESIEEVKNILKDSKNKIKEYISVIIGNLIGQSVRFENEYHAPKGEKYNELWQIIFMQFTNPQPVEYLDIRRVGYTSTLKCIVNLIKQELIEN